jgi:5-oxoprolinase (ATP-hydrolysing) subunit A
MIAYQIGALQAMAAYGGEKVTHLKPHGARNNIAAENPDYAMAIGRAIKAVDQDIIYVALSGSEMEKAGHDLGLRVAREGFCDRRYDDEGNLWSRKHSDAMIRDPAIAAQQVVHMVLHNEVISRNGKAVTHEVDTLCVHGDEATAIPVAQACRKALETAGVKIVTLPEMKLS